MATTRDNEAFARCWNEEVWGRRNLEAVDHLVAGDFVGYDLSPPEPVRGPDGVRESVEALGSAFPDAAGDTGGT